MGSCFAFQMTFQGSVINGAFDDEIKLFAFAPLEFVLHNTSKRYSTLLGCVCLISVLIALMVLLRTRLTHHCNISFKVCMTLCWLINELQWLVKGDLKKHSEMLFWSCLVMIFLGT